MKIKFNSDGELPLNKTIEISSMIIDVRPVSHENNKYYRWISIKIINNTKMLYFYRIDLLEGIDVNKTIASK